MTPAQVSLLDWSPRPGGAGELQRYARFRIFHDSHPEIYFELVHLAREAKRAGRTRIGIRLLWERLRWTLLVERQDGEKYALNDHFPPFYSRLIQKQEADLRGFFETRGGQ